MKVLYTVYHHESDERRGNRFLYPVQNKGRFQTPEQAQTLADIITKKGEVATVGQFYIFTREEWHKDQYKSRSIENPDIKTTVIRTERGSTLIFEGLHFEIV